MLNKKNFSILKLLPLEKAPIMSHAYFKITIVATVLSKSFNLLFKFC